MGILINIALAFFALLGIETMAYRKQFHELNSLVSLISMHQSTKDVLGLTDPKLRQNNLQYLSLCSDLLALLFPGFHDDSPHTAQELPRTTEERVRSLSTDLTNEICRSLRQDEPRCPTERAEEIASAFLAALPSVRGLLHSDLEAAFADTLILAAEPACC